MTRISGTVGLVLGVVAFACSGSDGGPDDVDVGAADAGSEFPAPERGVQLRTGEIAIPSGTEVTICVFFDVDNDVQLDVVKLEQTNSGFVHHFILFKNGGDTEPGMGECPGGLFTQHSPIYPGTRDQGPFEMPPNIALPLAPRQKLILQLHLLNATDTEVVEDMRMNLFAGEPGIEYEKAGVVGGSDFDFRIPPHAEHTESQRCYITRGINLFALTSHSHERTISFDVVASVGGNPTDIYNSLNWSEPNVELYSPSLEMSAFDWFEFSCTWHNSDDIEVAYGDSASDEMCMMFGYFYPASTDLMPCIGL